MANYFFFPHIPCQCSCGAEVRIRDTDQQIPCPDCKKPILIEEHATGEAPVMIRIQTRGIMIDQAAVA